MNLEKLSFGREELKGKLLDSEGKIIKKFSTIESPRIISQSKEFSGYDSLIEDIHFYADGTNANSFVIGDRITTKNGKNYIAFQLYKIKK